VNRQVNDVAGNCSRDDRSCLRRLYGKANLAKSQEIQKQKHFPVQLLFNVQ